MSDVAARQHKVRTHAAQAAYLKFDKIAVPQNERTELAEHPLNGGMFATSECADVFVCQCALLWASNDLAIRRAIPSDACVVADVWLRSVAAALPTVRRRHT